MQYLYSIDAGSNLFIWKWTEEVTEKYQNFRQARKRARDNVKGGVKQENNKIKEEEEEDG